MTRLAPALLALAALAAVPLARTIWPTDRATQAAARAEPRIRKACAAAKVPYPPRRLFLRGFKQERELEVWAQDERARMKLLRTYRIAAMSGGPGPKRREGDRQVPEGVYHVDRFNPGSAYHLSLGINYPNISDKTRSDPSRPGGDIFIHGGSVSIGCLAMTDEKIEEIYTLALGAKRAGRRIEVHLFPCRMRGEIYTALRRAYPQHRGFWSELEPVYDSFETKKRVPTVLVKAGAYRVSP